MDYLQKTQLQRCFSNLLCIIKLQAAFQYGVKMADGRRTRKFNKEKNEKAELDREWQKIQNIIQKRKGPATSKDSEPSFKVPRY